MDSEHSYNSPSTGGDCKPVPSSGSSGGAKSETEHINLRVQGQDALTLDFKMKRSTNMGRMMKAYCDKKCIQPSAVRFLYDGQRILETHTADKLGMEDGDVVDVVLQQTGGCV